MPKKEKLIIIDGNALLHRAWHALPPLTTRTGELVSAVYGFSAILLRVIKDFKPKYAVVTFDLAGPTFRHEEFKDYKAQRVKQPDELYEQIPRCREVVESFGIPIYEKKGFEADDVIGTICVNAQVNNKNIESIVVTGDLDTLQLVDDNTKVFTLRRGLADTIIYDVKAVRDRYDLEPAQLVDYKAIAGDPSDNIPGVKGIGQKGAQDLIKTFGSLENLYKELEENTGRSKKIRERVKKFLLEQKKQAFDSKKLVTIVQDVPLNFRLEDTKLGNFDEGHIFKLFSELEFKSLLNKIPVLAGKTQGDLFAQAALKKKSRNKNYVLVDKPEIFEKFWRDFKKQEEFACDTETTSLNSQQARLLGLSFSWEKGQGYYVISAPEFIKKLKQILENKKIRKIGHNLKYDKAVLRQAGIMLEGIYFDTMIASYLLYPGSRSHGLDNLAFTEFGQRMIPIENLIGKKGKNQLTMDQVSVDEVAEYAVEDADFTWRLYETLSSQLIKNNIDGLFHDLEMPLVAVLEEMEAQGVKIDVKLLARLSKEVTSDLKKIDQKIFKLTQTEFNIDSPRQLKEILFKKLKISTQDLKRTKTGISTAASELEKMKKAHPIIPQIIKHRELAKLKNTYLDALPCLVEPRTQRVHTSFNQTVTATGRLSSSDPNLQNIPIRTKLGQKIRRAFVAEKGFKIVTADYSQIELRVIASLAQDKNMIEVFERGEDIHRATAAKIFDLPLEKVDKAQRRQAKAVNFGVIYGMGVYGLAKRTGLSHDQARDFIEKYFEVFCEVKEYLAETIVLARELGYVETLFGRRRYLPDIKSGVSQIRNAAERAAVNHPIQGTAADLMKKAMIKIQQRLPEISAKSKMILQVHDELVFEVPKDEVKKVANFVAEEMTTVAKLRVPIEVKVEVGDNWGELGEIISSR